MNHPKKVTTYEEQLMILESRGCAIDDTEFGREILSHINYYRLTAYLLPFRENSNYRGNINLSRVYNIYEFDRKLRNILYGVLESIEISLKAKISYYHAHKYGALGYLNPSNFNKKHDHNKFIDNLDKEIHRNRNNLFVKHHITQYNRNFPIWVISELFSFGMVSYFYSDLPTHDQKNIAAMYNVNYKDLRSWLRCLTDLRNICAHFGRLYFRIFTAIPANVEATYAQKQRLWGLMLVLKEVYPSKDDWNDSILPRLAHLIETYHEDIQLFHIAFPKDWEIQLKYK